MPTPTDILRVFRDHVRYTGDGLPGEPTGAPLPGGSPRSGVHDPSKRDIRDILVEVVSESGSGAAAIAGEALEKADAAIAVSTPYANYAGALAADKPTAQTRISALFNGRLIEWVRQSGGPCLGGGWVPASEVTPQHFGGVTNTQIAAALAYASTAGVREVYLPAGSYTSATAITIPNGRALVSEGKGSAVLTLTSGSRLVNMAATTGGAIRGLRLVGTAGSGSDAFVDMAASVDCEVTDCEFINCPGSIYGVVDIQTGSFNKVSRNLFIGNRVSGIAIRADAHDNEANSNEFRSGVVGFGIRCEGWNNDLSFNRCVTNPIELIGVFRVAYANRVIGNHAEGTGDNGISISGKRNTVVGNICQYNDKAGIWVWGSFNTITGNECIGNNRIVLASPGNVWSGIGVSANFGGCGQHNTITGNVCDDDQATQTQQNGIRLSGSSYVDWVASTSYTKATTGTYVTNGLNIYLMVTNGTVTSGTTAPVHTAGEVSDGGIIWRYVDTFVITKGSVNNTVVGNTLMRSVGDRVLDTVGGTLSMIIDRSMVKMQAEGNVRTGTTSAGAWDIDFGGLPTHRFLSNRMRPVTDAAVSIGDTNARYSTLYIGSINKGPAGTNILDLTGAGSPEGAVTASVGSTYINRTGTPGSIYWDKLTGTGNTGWSARA